MTFQFCVFSSKVYLLFVLWDLGGKHRALHNRWTVIKRPLPKQPAVNVVHAAPDFITHLTSNLKLKSVCLAGWKVDASEVTCPPLGLLNGDFQRLRAGVADWGCGEFTVSYCQCYFLKTFWDFRWKHIEKWLQSIQDTSSSTFRAVCGTKNEYVDLKRKTILNKTVWLFNRGLNLSSCCYAGTHHKSMWIGPNCM